MYLKFLKVLNMSGKTKGYLNMERKTNNDTIATLKLSGEAETIISGAD